ncbi:5'-methylthioadenosine/adenosylhomocysteine nucleosidase [Emticicia sp. BO119]|uniref:5'-methylthioadenosine/adenosylhomocysteine nucleosidase n=1 Tax=Emticicia sp. BO119 TaxID=2757768 RepID=UPI001E2E6180|nr:5'-methylthioadenosine/adenosylhomocysteine nucleosidase [Emticicia sp. BO119]
MKHIYTLWMKLQYIIPTGYRYSENVIPTTDISSLMGLKISHRDSISVDEMAYFNSKSRRDDILLPLNLFHSIRIFLLCFLFSSLTPTFAQRIAILGAMPEEIQLLESEMSHINTKTVLGFQFKTGKLNGKKIVLTETGIGKVNAAVVTTLIIKEFHPASVIFTGIAGGISEELKQGDIVIGNKLTYHDYGMLTNEGLSTNATRNPITKQLNPLYFASDSLLVLQALSVAKEVTLQKMSAEASQPNISAGTIVTGDTFVTSSTAVGHFEKTLQASATEMEGAAVAQVCFQQHIPFLIIRSISDKANEKASVDFQTFKKIASDNSATLVKEILKKL